MHRLLKHVCMHFRDDPPVVSVTSDNLKSCINSGGDSAPGPDSVKYSHMKGLSEKDNSDNNDLLNQSLEKGETPDDWLDSHLTPVPKTRERPKQDSIISHHNNAEHNRQASRENCSP